MCDLPSFYMYVTLYVRILMPNVILDSILRTVMNYNPIILNFFMEKIRINKWSTKVKPHACIK